MKIKYAAAEAVLVFAAVMGILWILPRSFSFLYYPLFLLLIFTWKIRKDSLHDLGLLPTSFRYMGIVMLGAVCIAAVLGLTGWALHDYEITITSKKFFNRFSSYILWGLFQQFILNGYFTHRFSQAIRSQKIAAACSGILFALIHLPNPLLFGMTLFCGPLSAFVFLKNRNLYMLALAHALIGASFIFFSGLPFFTMRVGPGYFHH